MQTIESLRKQIKSVTDLGSVVKTMKILAAVSIRQYERAVTSLDQYRRTLEMGFQILLRSKPEERFRLRGVKGETYGIILFGSEQGMCGQFNEQIISFAQKDMEHKGIDPNKARILALGSRILSRLEPVGITPTEFFNLPGSVAGITAKVQEVVLTIEKWRSQNKVEYFLIYFNEYLSSSTYRSQVIQLLPMDIEWLNQLSRRKWESRSLPMFTMERNQLASALIRHYLFVSLYRSFAESLASENASRMVSMQGAEKNIADRLSDLVTKYHQQRQTSITEELMDIVSGFEALTGEK